MRYYPVTNKPSNPLTRRRINERINFGIKALMLACGRGQRLGIPRQRGQKHLMGMIARMIRTNQSRWS